MTLWIGGFCGMVWGLVILRIEMTTFIRMETTTFIRMEMMTFI